MATFPRPLAPNSIPRSILIQGSWDLVATCGWAYDRVIWSGMGFSLLQPTQPKRKSTPYPVARSSSIRGSMYWPPCKIRDLLFWTDPRILHPLALWYLVLNLESGTRPSPTTAPAYSKEILWFPGMAPNSESF